MSIIPKIDIHCNCSGIHNADAAYLLDEDGFIIEAKGAMEAISGYSPFELLGKSFAQLLPISEIPVRHHHFKQVLHGETVNFISRIIHKNSSEVEIIVKASPIIIEGKGTVICGLVNLIRTGEKDGKPAKRAEEPANV